MYKHRFICIFLFIATHLKLFSQEPINGTFLGQEAETIIIEGNSFKILANALYWPFDMNDRVISWGNVKLYNDNFIELNSVDYQDELWKSTVISESYDSTIKDSTTFKFSFPFSGKYRITIYIYIRDRKETVTYELTNKKEIVLPIKLTKSQYIDFSIYKENASFIDNAWNNCKVMPLHYFNSYHVEKNNSNLISISIPELTDKFFYYYFLKKEYVRWDGNFLWWRGHEYEKYGMYIEER